MADWTTNQLKKLKGYYRSLLGQTQILGLDKKADILDQTTFGVIAEEIERIDKRLPDLLPPLRAVNLRWRGTGRSMTARDFRATWLHAWGGSRLN